MAEVVKTTNISFSVLILLTGELMVCRLPLGYPLRQTWLHRIANLRMQVGDSDESS